MKPTEVVIIGGGLAGLTAAIHLRRDGVPVTVIEKNKFPHHKVCGEYLSSEIIPYLRWLDIDLTSQTPVAIHQLEFTTINGKMIHAALPLGGIGITRFQLDFSLYRRAVDLGCRVLQQQVTGVSFVDGLFHLKTKEGMELSADVVLGAFGKRSSLDIKLSRNFIQKQSPWLAVKAHYKGKHQQEVVGLHTFPGGYCGISMVEGGILNVCYLVEYDSFKQYRNIAEHREKVLFKNPVLCKVLSNLRQVSDRPLTISQVSFAKKEPVFDHILMGGDSAGLIHPLCGNGMAMAIHSSKLACESILDFIHGKISRKEMERNYCRQWKTIFGRRMQTGRMIAWLLRYPGLTIIVAKILRRIPRLIQVLIRRTHGNPVKINEHHYQHKVAEYNA